MCRPERSGRRAATCRKVSLTRLEKAIRARLDAGQQPTDEMNCLAGLHRLRYVFLYPDSGDVVIAGPAEGWFRDLSGRVITLTAGQPVLELQDLIVALRAYPPGQEKGPLIGCSIDPTPEGLARMQNFLRSIGGSATPDQTDFIVDGFAPAWGCKRSPSAASRPRPISPRSWSKPTIG